MTIDNGSNSPGILSENVSIGSYGSSSIGTLLEEEEDELLEIELDDEKELLEELLDELIELFELELEMLLDDELALLELEDELLLDEVVLVSFLELETLELDDSSLVVLLVKEVDSSLLVVDSTLSLLVDIKLVLVETPVLQADNIKAPNRVIE